MHNKIKIFNDPIYGLVSFPFPILYDIIEHPYVQRLRRISQTGLTYLVYPGATHTRFHHALGALHLMSRAIEVLRSKGVEISDQEAEGACIAILLHDVGHGPFSHALEGMILPLHHESISLAIFDELNTYFGGQLSLAKQIFDGTYPRRFLHQLVSSQLDMDRLDYLNRDSFFTGVAEGIIGYDRIIAMLSVVNDEIVVEEKGVFSIDKFLIARTIMYWQVYLHKTVLSAEKMLVHFWQRYMDVALGRKAQSQVEELLQEIHFQYAEIGTTSSEILALFCELDDYDVYSALKKKRKDSDFLLKHLSKAILDRKIHHIKMSETSFSASEITSTVAATADALDISEKVAKNLIFIGQEETKAYSAGDDDIRFLLRDKSVLPLQALSTIQVSQISTVKYYLCQPRI